MYNRCTKCQGPLIETPEGEIVCSQCGTVHGYRYWDSPLTVTDDIITKKVLASDAEDGSFISRSVRDFLKRPANIFYRKLREYHIHIKYGNRSTHLRVFKELNLIAFRLGLPNHVVNEAKKLYIFTCQHIVPSLNRKRPFYHRIAAACLIYVAKKYGYNINKILRAYAERGHRISLSNVWEIMQLLSKKGVIYRGPSIKEYTLRFLSKVMNTLNLSVKERRLCLRECNLILKNLDQRLIQGKSPRILAATIVYYAVSKVINRGNRVSVKTIAKILDVNESSIRKRLPTIISVVKNVHII